MDYNGMRCVLLFAQVSEKLLHVTATRARLHSPLPRVLAVALLIPMLAAACVAQNKAKQTGSRIVAPGLEYSHERIAEGPLSIHVVKLDLARKDLGVVVNLANGVVLGRETVRSQVGSLPETLGKPLAAVNGDYFEMGENGDPRYAGALEGLHIGNGELVHEPHSAVLWINTEGMPHLSATATARFGLTWPDGSKTSFGINGSLTPPRAPVSPGAHTTEVSTAGIMLFTPTFGTSTRTQPGLELTLTPANKSDWLPLRVNRAYTAVIQSVNHKGDTRIAAGTMVLSVAARVADKLPPIQAGDRIALTTSTEPDLSGAKQAIGGGPVLLVGGKIDPRIDRVNRAPRTAIGFNATHLFLVVVDGRQPQLSIGMNHGELADLMARLGCTDALNLDGGGSSTLWLDGAVVNSPSDAAGERPVGNAVVIVQRAIGKPVAQ